MSGLSRTFEVGSIMYIKQNNGSNGVAAMERPIFLINDHD